MSGAMSAVVIAAFPLGLMGFLLVMQVVERRSDERRLSDGPTLRLLPSLTESDVTLTEDDVPRQGAV